MGASADDRRHGRDDRDTTQLTEAAQPYVYVPLRQFFTANTGVALHVAHRQPEPLELCDQPSVRRFAAIDPAMPPPVVTTLATIRARRISRSAWRRLLLAILASLALALSAIGLYSLVSFGVASGGRKLACAWRSAPLRLTSSG